MKTTYFRSIATLSVSKLTNSFFVTLAAFALVAFVPLPASASLIITAGVDNTGTDNVLFNVGGLANDALLIQGVLNNPASTLVQFNGTDPLHSNGGQARIEGLNAGYDFLSVQILGQTFTKLVWNLNTENGAPAGVVVFTLDGVAYDGPDADMLPDEFAIGDGSNFFTIEATDGMTIGVAQFLTTTPLLDTRQIRIGGVSVDGPGGDPDVPEPATLMTMGLALVGVSLVRRYRS